MKRIFSEITLEEIRAALGPDFRQIVKEELSNNKQNQKPDEIFYSRSDVSRLLNLSLSSLNKYVKNGSVPARRLNGKVFFLRSEILDCMKPVRALKGSRPRGY